MSDRYNRQTLINGWDQSLLTQTSLLILGSGTLARFTSLMAAAMGFGRIVLLGNGRVREQDQRFLLADTPVATSVVGAWTDVLRAINPEIEVDGVHDLPRSSAHGRLGGSHIIIETSGLPAWKAAASALASHLDACVIAAGSSRGVGAYQVGRPFDARFASLKCDGDDPLLAMLVGALVVEEARRLVMPLCEPDRTPAQGLTLVSPRALHQAGGGEDPAASPQPDSDLPLRLSIVGAGAIGTWVGIAMGMSARRELDVRIHDSDIIDKSNINRQILYCSTVHQPKAEVLAGRMADLFPQVSACGHAVTVDEGNVAQVFDTDVAISGPDNFGTRALLHRAALDFGKPLVNGGTSAFGANVAAYVPGRSPCLECSSRVATLARRLGAQEERARCGGVPEASVVTSNAIAGALMAYEVIATAHGCPTRGVIEYDANAPARRRLGVRSARPPCTCHRRIAVPA